jgi:hypothetical protein
MPAPWLPVFHQKQRRQEGQVYLDDPYFDASPQSVSQLEFELAWDEMDNTYAIINE